MNPHLSSTSIVANIIEEILDGAIEIILVRAAHECMRYSWVRGWNYLIQFQAEVTRGNIDVVPSRL